MFPDIANVLAIREALWRHRALGSASIMVGAGFSRNSDPVGASARPMPTWAEMAEALCRPLYPADGARLQAALEEARGTSGFLRLAQEFQVAFGAAALNDRIRYLAPDTDYRPGDLHRRLLRLPWADVFSTNWDTLLERAQSDVFNRSYDVIRTHDEIPLTKRPRIVKLHGSFPAHQPFVFTEDDYRSYPVTHAPFVNLVQQSMMETLFCLIGFSGDDPNFLHWAGWVRDNLGSSAPRIYLVGWLALSNHRRRMLEARNVMPIDLSALPAASSWPAEHRHRYAAEWFIAAMEGGEPYNPSDWPAPRSSGSETANPVLGDLPSLGEATPVRVTWNLSAPSTDAGSTMTSQTLAWRINRKTYPGWLIAPGHVREAVWSRIQRWFSAFDALSDLTELQKLEAIAELSWQLDLCQFPMFVDLEAAAFSALEQIDYSTRKVGGEEVADWDRWIDLMAMSDRLALSLARNARHSADRARFDRALALLGHRQTHDTVLLNAVTYENCLWDYAAGDLSALTTRLAAWTTVHGDALWTLRKAGLLAEIREHERACEFLEDALASVRRGRRRDIDDIPSLSLESWAMYLALAYDGRTPGDHVHLPEGMPRTFERWRELASLDCDAHGEYAALVKTLRLNKGQPPAVTQRRGFDLNHAATNYHWSAGVPENLRAAYAALLISEVTSIPASARNAALLEPGMWAAALVLADKEPWMTAHWAVRMSLDSAKLDELLDRRWVARLSFDKAIAIRDAMLKRTAFMLARMSDSTSRHDVRDVATCLEVLSRVAVRLPAPDLIVLAREALGYFEAPVFARESHQLWRPLRNLLKRALEAMSLDALSEFAPNLFSAPLPGESTVQVGDEHFDPIMLLPDWFEMKADVGAEGAVWRQICSRLLAAVSGGPKTRGAAVARLQRLFEWGVLTEDEVRLYAAGLWDPERLTPEGLPADTMFLPWVAVKMPALVPGQALAALNRSLEAALASERPNGDVLMELADLAPPLTHEHVSLNFDAAARAQVRDRILKWASEPVVSEPSPLHRMFMDSVGDDEKALKAVATLLEFIDPDRTVAAALWKKCQALGAVEDPKRHGFPLYPAIAKIVPEHAADLFARIRRGLASDNPELARRALRALFLWLQNEAPSSTVIGSEIDQALRTIAFEIAACRRAMLEPNLSFASWVFRSGPRGLGELMAADCDLGLSSLTEVASYAEEDEGMNVPAVRAECVRLALAMEAAGFGAGPGVQGWLGLAGDDPLPEVRHAGDRQKAKAGRADE